MYEFELNEGITIRIWEWKSEREGKFKVNEGNKLKKNEEKEKKFGIE